MSEIDTERPDEALENGASPDGESPDARLAEAEILHGSKMRAALEPEARETAEQEYRRDRDRVITDRDRKIEEIRRGKA